MSKIFKKNKNSNGYAILETLFYLALFSVLSIVVINAMITMTRSFREIAIEEEFVQSGSIMEKMSREIRAAYGIDATSTNTDLKINTTSGTNTKIEFNLSGSDIQFFEDETFTGNLNTPNIIITALTFTQITTAKGAAVKVFLTVRSANDASNRTQSFYDTIVLRGDYNN